MKTMSWKLKLMGRIAREMAREIDVYEMQLELRRRGELDAESFARARRRRGVFARPQRAGASIAATATFPDYGHGHEHEHEHEHDDHDRRVVRFRRSSRARGPGAPWDEPGVQRVLVPSDGLRPEQLEAIAEVAEEYAGGVARFTSRRDIELDFVHIEDTPDLMRRLAVVHLTTRVGRVRARVHAATLAGVCATELFDVSPHVDALAKYLANSVDGRARIAIGVSGCEVEPCSTAIMHDLAFVARSRTVGDSRGFAVFAGGHLGAQPNAGAMIEAFIPESELLPVAQAACRVVRERGESMAEILRELGVRELARLVRESRATLEFDPRWGSFLAAARARERSEQRPLRATEPIVHLARAPTAAFRAWVSAMVRMQKQPGFAAVTIMLPRGHLSSRQARKVADVVRRYSGDHLRATIDRALVLRWISDRDLQSLYDELVELGLGSYSGAFSHV